MKLLRTLLLASIASTVLLLVDASPQDGDAEAGDPYEAARKGNHPPPENPYEAERKKDVYRPAPPPPPENPYEAERKKVYRPPRRCADRNQDGICDRIIQPPPCIDVDGDNKCDIPLRRPCVDRDGDGRCDRHRPPRPPRRCADRNQDGICDRIIQPPPCIDLDGDNKCDIPLRRPCVDRDGDGRCDQGRPRCQCRPTCANSMEWRSADERARELEEAAESARRRLDAINAASARVRADPHYVYQPVSPYHHISGAQGAYNRALRDAEAARSRANSLCPGADGFFIRPGCEAFCRGRQPPPPPPDGGNICPSREGQEARRRANEARVRLERLRTASARARADPHYVYGGASPYHMIQGAEGQFNNWDGRAKRLGC